MSGILTLRHAVFKCFPKLAPENGVGWVVMQTMLEN